MVNDKLSYWVKLLQITAHPTRASSVIKSESTADLRRMQSLPHFNNFMEHEHEHLHQIWQNDWLLYYEKVNDKKKWIRCQNSSCHRPTLAIKIEDLHIYGTLCITELRVQSWVTLLYTADLAATLCASL